MFDTFNDPTVVENLTAGVFTVDTHGHLSTDPATATWLAAFNGGQA